MADKLKLISSIISPYCHRVEMTLIEKNIPYTKEEITLADKPDWFIKDAPLGKVPLLYVGEKPLFNSLAICEYLDEAFDDNKLHSTDPLMKAWHRGWMEFSNGLLAATFGMVFSQNKKEFTARKEEISKDLTIFAQHLKFSPYFDGDKFSLIDISMASAFKPLLFLDNKFTLEIFDANKNIANYVDSVVSRGSLTKSLSKDYEEFFINLIKKRKSHLLTMTFTI